MPFLLLLKGLPWRAIGYGVAVLAILALGWRVHAWREAYKALPEVQAALEAERGCGAGSECEKRVAALQARQKAIDEQTVRDYEQKLADIANRPPPAWPVRLCRPADHRVRVPGSAPTTGPGSGGDVPQEAGRDIAVELYRLADDADTEALKLRLLWDRDQALAQGPK